MVNTPQITINATTFLVNVGRFTTKARKNVTILVNDTSASYYIILCRYFTTKERAEFLIATTRVWSDTKLIKIEYIYDSERDMVTSAVNIESPVTSAVNIERLEADKCVDRGQRQEERFQDQLLIGTRLGTINDTE